MDLTKIALVHALSVNEGKREAMETLLLTATLELLSPQDIEGILSLKEDEYAKFLSIFTEL